MGANVVGNPSVIPIMRWNIFWKENRGGTELYYPFKVTKVMYRNQ